MLEIRGLRKRFGVNEIFREADLSLSSGRTYLLEAPNGCGKTTLLRLIGGTLAPDAGAVSISARIGMMAADEGGFYPRLTILQNLEFFGALHGLNKKAVRE